MRFPTIRESALQHLFKIDVPLQLFCVLLLQLFCVLLCHQLMALSKVAWRGKGFRHGLTM